jgi:rhodanese-related sulfurtransferase
MAKRKLMEPAIDFDAEAKLHPEDHVTTEQFVTMVIKGSKGNIEPTRGCWSSGYMDYALYKGIIEDYDLTKKDEYEWSAAENLKDLYSCHTCVMHIAQMYVKGIMLGRDHNLFDAAGSLTHAEAAAIVVRLLDREQRIPQTGGRVFQSKSLTPDEAWELMLNDHTAMLVDVRTNEDYKTGHIQESICIPLHDISNNPFSVCVRKDTPIILYCQKGYKSSAAAQALIDAGYSRIYTIPGIEQYPYHLI